jgi:hypothetical protein
MEDEEEAEQHLQDPQRDVHLRPSNLRDRTQAVL